MDARSDVAKLLHSLFPLIGMKMSESLLRLDDEKKRFQNERKIIEKNGNIPKMRYKSKTYN